VQIGTVEAAPRLRPYRSGQQKESGDGRQLLGGAAATTSDWPPGRPCRYHSFSGLFSQSQGNRVTDVKNSGEILEHGLAYAKILQKKFPIDFKYACSQRINRRGEAEHLHPCLPTTSSMLQNEPRALRMLGKQVPYHLGLNSRPTH
jgi:hypothetical protein